MPFQKATKTQSRGRVALIGPAGSGKTMTALQVAEVLAAGGRIAVVDTEHGSASKYADVFDFDTLELDSFSPRTYTDAIHEAEAAGYAVLVIDSLSHAWMGKDGALEQVDRAAKRSQSGNSYTAWRDVTPMHNDMVEAIVGARMHVIATMRSKMEYVQEKDDKGKTVIRKVGLQPVQRDGLEYEFDVVADIDQDHTLIVGKTRCPALDGFVQARAGGALGEALRSWLTEGSAAPDRSRPAPGAPAPSRAVPQDAPCAAAAANGATRTSTAPQAGDGPATEKQRKAIYAIANKVGATADDMRNVISVLYQVDSTVNLTAKQASDLIDQLKTIETGERDLASWIGEAIFGPAPAADAAADAPLPV